MDPGYLNNIISVVVASTILPFTLFFGIKTVILGIEWQNKDKVSIRQRYYRNWDEPQQHFQRQSGKQYPPFHFLLWPIYILIKAIHDYPVTGKSCYAPPDSQRISKSNITPSSGNRIMPFRFGQIWPKDIIIWLWIWPVCVPGVLLLYKKGQIVHQTTICYQGWWSN